MAQEEKNSVIAFEAGKPLTLPAPLTEGGKPLFAALSARQSSREFSDKALPLPVLSQLLWTTAGINRKDLEKKTSPTARNWQDLDVYVALKQGLFLYNAQSHALVPVLPQDLREQSGQQPFVGQAPVNLVFVSDWSKMDGPSDDKKRTYSGAHAGFASQNAYLFCASEGLSTVVRALIDEESLHAAMKLRPEQRIVLAQTVGYPAP